MSAQELCSVLEELTIKVQKGLINKTGPAKNTKTGSNSSFDLGFEEHASRRFGTVRDIKNANLAEI